MKASLQILDSEAGDDNRRLLLRTKIPVSALGLPFSIAATAGTRSSDLSFRLASSSSGGPTLSLSYHPTSSSSPFSFSLKSGVGTFGSPADSPLVLSARFDLARPGSAPVFSLHLRPRFGHFSLKRFVLSSSPSQNVDAGGDDGLISGVSALAQSEVPVGKSAAVRLRWAVNFPTDMDKGVPFLTLDKLSVERVEDDVVQAAKSAIAREAVEGMGGYAEEMKRLNASVKLLVGAGEAASGGEDGGVVEVEEEAGGR